ncbi:DUF6602 domain-containing protein [Leptospira mtsangambouensis]|uniref:DUF6602 domain-containing protein n=1 Tax=Leptospira mtsangambouensis TaxID=2484912 RepID=UPI001EEC131B|nr:DUF6602 domain-containing protein [Leptospira mtsangambouensis]MCG6139808.1 tetratricopeptide repeat protein [Leptospira mtsangambouensis]
MPNKTLQDRLKADILKILSDSTTIENLNHMGLRGLSRELNLASLLKNYLPFNLGIGKGMIQDSFGNQSSEIDLLIYDKAALPPVLFGENGEVGIFPFESVLYAFEVKSTSTIEEIRSTNEKFKKIQNLKAHSKMMHRIRTIYFAYDSDLTVKSELERYFEIDEILVASSPPIQIICVLGKGYWYHGSTINQGILVNLFWQYIGEQENFFELAYLISGILNTVVPQVGVGYYLLPASFAEYAFFQQFQPFIIEYKNENLEILNEALSNYELEDDEAAVASICKFTFENKTKSILLNDLASKRHEEKKYIQSLPYLTKSLELEPKISNNTLFLYLLAVGYSENKNFEQALNCFKEIEIIDPNFSGLNYSIGTVYFKDQKYSIALEYYNKSLLENPGYIDNYLQLAKCHINLNNKAEAKTILQKSVLLGGDKKEILSLLSYC